MTLAPPRSVTRLAHAKVNLHLAVLSKRPDGYHELETVFERVGLADKLTVERAPGACVELSCRPAEVPSDGRNLVVKAALAFREASGWRDGVRVALEKKIPVGGGMGGGSSDAAATLLALQELSGQALPPAGLTRCARELGADVAFFAADCAWAVGRGRGDEIEPLADAGSVLWHLLVTPDFPIPTKSVYQALRLTAPGPDATLLLRNLKEGSVPGVRDHLFNALEPTVEQLYPAIRRVKSAVETLGGLPRPLLSGSGSTVFAVADSREQAEAAAERVRSAHPGWHVSAVSTQR